MGLLEQAPPRGPLIATIPRILECQFALRPPCFCLRDNQFRVHRDSQRLVGRFGSGTQHGLDLSNLFHW